MVKFDQEARVKAHLLNIKNLKNLGAAAYKKIIWKDKLEMTMLKEEQERMSCSITLISKKYICSIYIKF